MCECNCLHLYLWKPDVGIQMSSVVSPLYFLRHSLSLKLDVSARLTKHQIPGLCLSLSPRTRVIGHVTVPDFYLNVKDPNSGPHAYLVNTLPTEPSSPAFFIPLLMQDIVV